MSLPPDTQSALEELDRRGPQHFRNAEKPPANQYEGCFIYVIDAPLGSRMQYSDGTNWNPV